MKDYGLVGTIVVVAVVVLALYGAYALFTS